MSLKEFAQVCLKTHNDYRRKHVVPPLVLNEKISAISQQWAEKLIKTGTLKHSDNQDYGENIFCMTSTDPNISITGDEPVDRWYKESENHNFEVEPQGLDTGHFTQLIWKSSKEIGVGYAKKNGRVIVVVNYSPPGNYRTKFVENVPPVGGFKNLPKLRAEFNELKISEPKLDKAAFQREYLEANNKYRAQHGVEPLILNEAMCDFAQEWAQKLTTKSYLETRPDCEYGETIYKVTSTDPSFVLKGNEPVDKWYAESNNHNYNEEPSDLKTGHFTQLIWKDSKELGVGIVKHQNTFFVVANYSPAGNFRNQFVQNVPPPLKSERSARAAETSPFEVEGLNAHNEYRKKHGVAPLTLSKKLCNYAQEWANICAAKESMSHRPKNSYGENIYYCFSTNPPPVPSAKNAVKSWYDEIEMHVFGTENLSGATFHFTQVVWKGSKELGIAFAKDKSGGTYVVANYDPPGNLLGTFKDNVFKPK